MTLDRQEALARARSVVVKVGSAVLTTPEGLNLPVLRDLVDQLHRLARAGRRVTLVSSGAVAAGRTALAGTELKIEGVSGKQAAAAIGQGRLMREYEDAFAAHGMICAQVLLTRDDLRSRARFLNARNTFGRLLDWGVEISLSHTQAVIDSCTVHNVDNGALCACFDERVPLSVIDYMAKQQPLRAVFRDSSFAADDSKINVTEIFKNLSPDTKVKVI